LNVIKNKKRITKKAIKNHIKKLKIQPKKLYQKTRYSTAKNVIKNRIKKAEKNHKKSIEKTKKIQTRRGLVIRRV
jgi:hypothetical protein